MKAAYVVCALLCVTFGTLVLANDDAAGKKALVQPESNDTNNTKNGTTTAVPISTTTNVTKVTDSSSSTITAIPINITTASSSVTTPSTPTTKSSTSSSVTPNVTTPAPPISTTNASTPVITTSTTTVSSSTTGARTTPIPSTAPSTKDRHFDGLSFFGGIILATCLMAISVFAWKFYKQCNEGNYRTL